MKYLRSLLLILVMFLPNLAQAGLFSGSSGRQPEHNALIDAADVSNQQYVQQLLASGFPVNSVNAEGQTALMRTAMRGNQYITKILLDAGASVNLQDKAGNTALHYAAAHDHIAVSDALIKHGAATSIANNAGKTPLQVAITTKSINVAKLIDPNALVAVESEALFPVVAAAGISGKTVLVGLGVAAAGGATAAAVSGGGGGGSSSSSSGGSSGGGSSGGGDSGGGTDDKKDSGTGTGSTFDPAVAEYNAQYGLGNVNASAAYARGYTGKNVVVAVIDTGIDLAHPDLAANMLSGHDFVDNDNNPNHDCGHIPVKDNSCYHGSHVAGIIAAIKNSSGMHGVAYDAKILPVRVMTSSSGGVEANVASGIDYAKNNGAKVINLSLGGTSITGVNPFPLIKTAIFGALNAGVVVVAATGNDAENQPSWPAKNAGDVTINPVTAPNAAYGALLAVSAVDSGNNFASTYANYCGDAKEWCLVAPGSSITSTIPTSLLGFDGYGVLDGTSMATPHVSGAVAILIEKFGATASPRLIALKLLNTATDLGASGVDDIYGHGLINLDAATNPAGVLSVPTGLVVASNDTSANRAPLATISASSVFGNALQSANVEFLMLDEYNFSYNSSLSSITTPYNNKNDFANSFSGFAQPVLSRLKMSNISDNLAVGFASVANDNLAETAGLGGETTSYFSMVTAGDDFRQSVNYNIPPAQSFGFGAVRELDGGNFQGEALHGNPYLALAADGISSLSNFAFEDNHLRTNFVMFNGNNRFAYGTQDRKVSGVAAEIAAEFHGFAVASQFGSVSEQDSVLGSHSSGAFAIGGANTPTWFYNFSASVAVAENTQLFGVYSAGVTRPEDAANSLINSVSALKSQALAGGVMRSENFTGGDVLGFSVSQPLHVTSGQANINVPYAVDLGGNIYRQNQALSLAPEAVETDVELFYKMPLAGSELSFGAMRRLQPNNIKDAASEDVLMFKLVNSF